MKAKRLLVTGGAGFIGSAFIQSGISRCEKIVNLDLLTYAADLQNLSAVERDPRYRFVQGNICDRDLVEKICLEEDIDTIVHFAAESHVDRSISSPQDFLEANVRGTLLLLEVVRQNPSLHFHHISTDEVYGSLALGENSFHEDSAYRPNSPYAASKAASDHFVRAYAQTYGISTTLSHCCNNYGPGQFPEKLIPLMIRNCLKKAPLPVYGKGDAIRDWLYVRDHAEAVWKILEKGQRGEVYAIGAETELANLDLLHLLIQELALQTGEDPQVYASLIAFVPDRPGHDFRYAIDSAKIRKELGWKPQTPFLEGIRKTIAWYIGRYSDMLSCLC